MLDIGIFSFELIYINLICDKSKLIDFIYLDWLGDGNVFEVSV